MIWVALTESSSAPTTENHMDKATQHDVETAVLSYRGYVGARETSSFAVYPNCCNLIEVPGQQPRVQP